MPRGKKTTGVTAPAAPPAARKRSRKKRKSERQIKSILNAITELRQSGSSISAALKEARVPMNTYYKWVKRFGTGAADTGKTEPASIAASSSKAEQMRVTVGEIQALKASGLSLARAIKQKGLTASNYYYWVKRLGAKRRGAASKAGKPTAASGAERAQGVVALLDAMKQNRAEAERLDAEWRELLRRLGAEA